MDSRSPHISVFIEPAASSFALTRRPSVERSNAREPQSVRKRTDLNIARPLETALAANLRGSIFVEAAQFEVFQSSSPLEAGSGRTR